MMKHFSKADEVIESVLQFFVFPNYLSRFGIQTSFKEVTLLSKQKPEYRQSYSQAN